MPRGHRRLPGDRGAASRGRRQRAGRAGPGAGGPRSPARGRPLPAARARDPGAGSFARSGHRAARRPRAHGAGRHRPHAGNYAAADRGYRTALAEIRRRFGPRDRYLAGVFNDLGVLRKAQGRYDDAFAFYRRALPLVRAAIAMRSRRWPTTWAGSSTRAATTPAPNRTREGPSSSARRWWARPPGRRRRRRRAGRDRRSARPAARGRRSVSPRAGGVRTRPWPDSLEVGLNLACLAAVEQRREGTATRPFAVRAGAAHTGAGARPPPCRRRHDRQQSGGPRTGRRQPEAGGGAVPARARQLHPNAGTRHPHACSRRPIAAPSNTRSRRAPLDESPPDDSSAH